MNSLVIQIGNSDNKLSQREWSDFISDIRDLITYTCLNIHFDGCSNPDSQYQNACFVVEIESNLYYETLLEELTRCRKKYRQDSVAVIVGKVDFI